MPNWCECDLKVSGPHQKVETFRNAISCADDKAAFRINNIIPLPDSLRDAVAGSDERFYDCLHGSQELFDNLKKIYKIETDDRMEALKEVGLQQLSDREDQRKRRQADCGLWL